jgi:hypothetical protein
MATFAVIANVSYRFSVFFFRIYIVSILLSGTMRKALMRHVPKPVWHEHVAGDWRVVPPDLTSRGLPASVAAACPLPGNI